MYFKRRIFSPTLFFIFTSLFSFQLFAQQDSIKIYNLNEITVTAQRFEKQLLDVGRSVSVIDVNEMKSRLFTSPAELLSNYEGIFITGTYQNPGSLQGLYMRGATPAQTVVLIDGMRITDPSSVDNAIDMSELSFNNISRIEMIRGSHSTLYGSSAIGGVINILTEKNKMPGFNADILLNGGTFGNKSSELTQNILLNYTAPNGFYVTGEIFNSTANGIDATIDTIATPGIFKTSDKDGFTKSDITGKIGYAANNLDLFFSYKNTSQKSDVDAGAFEDDDNYTIKFKRDLFNIGADYKFSSAISAKLQAGLTSMRRDAVNDSSVIDFSGNYDQSFSETNYEGTVTSADMQFNFTFQKMTIILGGGYYKETMNNKSYVYSNSSWGPYENLQDLDSLNINSSLVNAFSYFDLNGGIISPALTNFNFALGGRLNHHSKFGDYFTFEFNPSYKLSSDAIIYVSYASGFNAPPLYRLFSPNNNYISSITRGNENLKPEESKSLEAGLKYEINNNISLTISAFTTNVKNNIEYVYLWDKDIPLNELGNDWMRDDSRGDTYINLGTMKTQGIEAAIEARISSDFSMTANVSIIDGKLEYKPENIDTKHTQGHHVQLYSNGAFINAATENDILVRRCNTANLAFLYYPTEELFFVMNIRYVGKRDDVFYDMSLGPWGALGMIEVSDFTLFDISGKYAFSENLSATLSVKNIFDRNYYELRGYSTRGRGVYFGLRYTL